MQTSKTSNAGNGKNFLWEVDKLSSAEAVNQVIEPKNSDLKLNHDSRIGGNMNTFRVGERSGNHKLTDQQVLEIYSARDRVTQRKLAAQFQVSRTTIMSIHHHQQWRHITCTIANEQKLKLEVEANQKAVDEYQDNDARKRWLEAVLEHSINSLKELQGNGWPK